MKVRAVLAGVIALFDARPARAAALPPPRAIELRAIESDLSPDTVARVRAAFGRVFRFHRGEGG